MAWTWIRPADPDLLAGRPFLDLGIGDGQTVAALVKGPGRVVGLDRSRGSLVAARRVVGLPLVQAEAHESPFRNEAFEVVLAADLFHHLRDGAVRSVVEEAARVLAPGGRLVAWWYESWGRGDAGGPRYPRTYDQMESLLSATSLRPMLLPLVAALEPAPPTTGLTAIKDA